MCIAIVCETKKPSFDLLSEAEKQNPDGGGIAWVEQRGIVRFKKGLTAVQIESEIKHLSFPFFVHFRAATVAGKIASLAHPFAMRQDGKNELEGSSPYVLMHNGHWKEWKETLASSVVNGNRKLARGPWSDTRAMAYLAAHHGMAFLELIGDQRIATLNGEKEIRRFGSWHEKDGMFFSNHALFSSLPSASCIRPYEGTTYVGMSRKQRKEADKIAKRIQENHEKIAAISINSSSKMIPVEVRTPQQTEHLGMCKLPIPKCAMCSLIFGRDFHPEPPVDTLRTHFLLCSLTVDKCNTCQNYMDGQPKELPAPNTQDLLEKFNRETLNKAGME